MTIFALVTDEVHINALREARQLGRERPLPAHVLNAPLDDEGTTWVDRIWDKVEGALRRAYRDGLDAARELIDEAIALTRDLATHFARRADEVRAMISERLGDYLRRIIDGALDRVSSAIRVGESTLVVTKITVEQRIKLSGSLKASLESICALVAEGEITLSAEYGRAG